MANTRSHSPWRKTVLVPFWILQILLEILMIGTFGLALGVLAKYTADSVDADGNITIDNTTVNYNKVIPAVRGTLYAWIGLIGLCLILTVTEIILLFCHSLKPKTFIIMNSVKSAVWTAIFVFDIIDVIKQNSGMDAGAIKARSTVGIIIETVLLLCFLIPLIYGGIVFYRDRKGGVYNKVGHPYAVPTGNTAYPSAYTPFVYDHDTEANRTPGARRASYNHQKDTRFESYRRSYGGDSPQEKTVGANGPQIHVQHHSGETFEMSKR